MIPAAAVAVVRAAVEDAERDRDQAEDVVARIVAALAAQGWTIAQATEARKNHGPAKNG